MQELPRDLISSMMVYLDLPSLNRLSQTSKLINAAANSDLLWKQKCELIENEPKLYGQVTNWKQLFRELNNWKWGESATDLSAYLKVIPDIKAITRPSNQGTNPSVRTTEGFNRYKRYFEVTVQLFGGWIAIGASQKIFGVDSGTFVGSEGEGTIHCGFYSDTSQNNIKIVGTLKEVQKRISEGDVISMYMLDDKINYYVNGVYQECVLLSDFKLDAFTECKDIFDLHLVPTVSIGYGSELRITNVMRRKVADSIV